MRRQGVCGGPGKAHTKNQQGGLKDESEGNYAFRFDSGAGGIVVRGTCRAIAVLEELNFTGTVLRPAGRAGIPPEKRGFFIVPDTMGAVGPSHIVELNNQDFRVFDKVDGDLEDIRFIDDFWTDVVGVPVDIKGFDPRILYDAGTQRWLAVAADKSFADKDNPRSNHLLIGASLGPDPTGGWVGASFEADAADGTHFADFPTLGMTDDFVTISTKMVKVGSSGGFLHSIFSIPKADFLAGEVSNLEVIPKQDLLSIPRAPQSVVFNENPAGISSLRGTLFGVAQFDNNLTLAGVQPGAIGPLNSVSSNLDHGSPSRRGSLGEMPGDILDVDLGLAPIPGSVVFQNGSYYAVRGVQDPDLMDLVSIEWIKIDAGTMEVQSGIIRDPSSAIRTLAFPSIAVNDSGTMFIGFSGFSKETFIGAFGAVAETVNGQSGITVDVFEPTFPFQPADPPPPLITIQQGQAPYQRLDPDGDNRWGDYSATVLDPTDDNVFWTFQEYAAFDPDQPNTWATRIASYRTFERVVAGPVGTFNLVEILQNEVVVDEGHFGFADSIFAGDVNGNRSVIEGQTFRTGLDGIAGPGGSFQLAYQGEALNHLELDALQGFFGGALVDGAFDTVGVAPGFRIDEITDEVFVEYFNPYEFLLSVSDVQLFSSNDPSLLNLRLLEAHWDARGRYSHSL